MYWKENTWTITELHIARPWLTHCILLLSYWSLWCCSEYSGIGLHIDGLMQNCSNSIANTLESLQSCAKSPICVILNREECSRGCLWYQAMMSHWPAGWKPVNEICAWLAMPLGVVRSNGLRDGFYKTYEIGEKFLTTMRHWLLDFMNSTSVLIVNILT